MFKDIRTARTLSHSLKMTENTNGQIFNSLTARHKMCPTSVSSPLYPVMPVTRYSNLTTFFSDE